MKPLSFCYLVSAISTLQNGFFGEVLIFFTTSIGVVLLVLLLAIIFGLIVSAVGKLLGKSFLPAFTIYTRASIVGLTILMVVGVIGNLIY